MDSVFIYSLLSLCLVNREHVNTEGRLRDRPVPTGKEIHYLMFLHVLVRTLSAVSVSTEFVPDEAWQSTEVAHHLVFG